MTSSAHLDCNRLARAVAERSFPRVQPGGIIPPSYTTPRDSIHEASTDGVCFPMLQVPSRSI